MTSYDVAVIGAGPGGYTAAACAAREGLSTVLFEKDELGGTCLNRGCVPTKALLHASDTWQAIGAADELGLHVEGASYDFSAMHARKDTVVAKQRDGIAKLMKAGHVTVVSGEACIAQAGVVTCDGQAYEARDIIIATGSVPAVPPIEGRDLEGVYTSDDLLEGGGVELDSLAIVGGGVIGVELAGFYAGLGCQVTVLEAMDRILPLMDKDIATRLAAQFRKQGVDVQAKATVRGIVREESGMLSVSYENKKGASCSVSAEGVLIATGRRANTQGLFADDLGIECARGAVVADELGRTSVPHIYVIGDAKAGVVQLAHVAEAQAKNAVATIVGKQPPVDASLVPSCVYTTPEIASVGLTEAEAKEAGIDVICAKSLVGANAKCDVEGCTSGYIKLVARADDRVLVGAQLVYPRATDIVAELALAIGCALTVEQLAGVICAHPTFAEGVLAAAEAL